MYVTSQPVFAEKHPIEVEFGARASVILDAISMSSDLSKRGIKGLITECVFKRDVAPLCEGWTCSSPEVDKSYDACLVSGETAYRVQVKMQRSVKGQPMMRDGQYVVEVQRTRSGKNKNDGGDTRPYRFTDFDILAVGMYAASGRWDAFMYTSTYHLAASSMDPEIIAKMQRVPVAPDGVTWFDDLTRLLASMMGHDRAPGTSQL